MPHNIATKRMKNKRILLTALTLLASGTMLAACTPTMVQHGNFVKENQVKDIIPGIHTKSDALRILGSPTSVAAFDENIWYYVGRETEKRGILDPQVTDERIFVATFDENSVLQTLEEIDSQGVNIPVSRDKTPTHGNEITVMQQFFGNLGRFNPQSGQ